MISFKNKTVLITGGSRGIGKACALLFAGLDARVMISYNLNETEAQNTIHALPGEGHQYYQLDVSMPESVEKFFSLVLENNDRIDVVVNNAGIYLEHKIAELNFNDWQKLWKQTMDTNLTGVSNICYFAARHMIEKGGGKIINISSRGAFRGEPDHPAYGASKAGLNALSQSLAVALAPYRITVGVIAPGFVETEMANEYLQGPTGELIRKQSPMNRVATADEVARAVAVFASDGFEMMTGGIIDLNGASYLRS